MKARSEGHFKTVDIPRCAAELYPRLVLGENDLTVFERSLPWDHAAGAIFLNEAGGKLCRKDGSPYVVGDDRRGLLGAVSPQLWDEAEIGRAHVWTPVTNAQLVCRLLLDKKHNYTTPNQATAVHQQHKKNIHKISIK